MLLVVTMTDDLKYLRWTNGLSHADEVAPSGATWSPFISLGGGASNNGVAVAMNRDGRLEVFIINDPGDCWHASQTTAGGAWSSWGQMGSGLTGTPAAAQNQAVAWRFSPRQAGTNSIMHIWQTSPGNGWSNWASLQGGGTHNDVAAVGNRDGRLEVFIINDPGDCWHAWQTTAGGAWSSWGQIGSGLTGTPAAARTKTVAWRFSHGEPLPTASCTYGRRLRAMAGQIGRHCKAEERTTDLP